MDVKTVMDTWTLQMGFPLITVKRWSRSRGHYVTLPSLRDYSGNAATVSQDRFVVKSAQAKKSGSSKKTFRWWVPLTYTAPGGDFNDTRVKAWLTEKEASKRVEGLPAKDVPVVFNIQETGYYRVNYDQRNWQLLAQQLDKDHTAIHVINRCGTNSCIL